MKISVIGAGYVGLVVGNCLADFGNNVICMDIDKDKVDRLNSGISPIYEPGLDEILKRNIQEKRIIFTTELKEAVEQSDIIFIAVSTPQGKNFEPDLSAVISVAANIAKYLNNYKIIVTKSTVPVGTTHRIKKIIKEAISEDLDFDVVSNPEFLREGSAINDFIHPDRIIIGSESDKAKEIMKSLYSFIPEDKILFTDIKSAEIIKYASNALLATKISFINEIARLCEKVGADIKKVAHGVGLDSRIGKNFLNAGIGYGGSCLPKDIRALIHTMKKYGCKPRILEAVEAVNEEQKRLLLSKVKKLLPSLVDKKIAIWGLAFKPNTDDMREAPSIIIINQLKKEGVKIKAFDPEAEKTARKIFPEIEYCNDPYEAVKGCDCLIILTEWNIFLDLDKAQIKQLLNQPNVIDGRNIYEPEEMKRLGFNYIAIGR